MMDFPEGWEFGLTIQKWIDVAVDWMVVSWDGFFGAINIGVLRGILLPIERALLWLPWWLVVVVVVLIAWRIIGMKIAAIVALMLLGMAFMGLYDLTMETLAIVFTSTIISVGLGIPLGIVGARSDRFDALIRPILDMMQTMPSFVYLIPAVMLFGLGKVPAVVATVIYAVPPIIRLTNLGIRQVDPEVVEAARAFGTTSRQLLVKVQMPMAVPTIMAGVNQTVMMALAMVVVASMIGAGGLGLEVLKGINRLEVGRGTLAGIGIVALAIIIDRITQGIVKGQPARAT
jgi:glycine betaine/proline transport system permease protein